MLKPTKLVRFLPIVMLLLLASIPIATPVLSQANACPALVVKVVQRARAYCQLLDSGQICYADALTAQLTDAKTSLAKPGDIAPLANLKSVRGQAVNVSKETWGLALLKLNTALSTENAPTLAVLGDANVTNQVDPAKPLTLATATNRNQNSLNIFAAPDPKSAIIGQLAPLASVTANGRTAASDWMRVEYKGTLGWVIASAIALDSEIATLAEAKPGDMAALYPDPAQAITLESNPSSDCKDTPNGLLVSAGNGSAARLLVNGVQVETSGAAFLTAVRDGALTVAGLTGLAKVSASDKAVSVQPGSNTSVALADLQAKAAPSDPASGGSGTLTGLYASLINGQPFAASPAAPGLQIASTSAQATVGDPLRVQMSFTGDAAVCSAPPIKPQDVALVVDTSDAMQTISPDITRAAVTGFIQGFDGSTNRVALIGFDATGRTIAGFGETSADSVANLVTQKPGSAGTIQAGLAEALIALKSARSDASPAIVVITASAGNPSALEPIATDVKDRKIRLLTVGLGALVDHDLLTRSASASTDAVFAPSPLDLRDALEQVRLSLLHP
ncbi:MAG TPA: VWA domain-containing protein, partial [Aggregatilineales bacterium]|nr:VWA domain-containing protein [Aggregatilineales bacterium]